MKHIKKKIKEYNKMLESGDVNESAADKILVDLDTMITELESVISDKLEDINTDGEDFSDWDVTLMDGLDKEE